MTVDPIQLLMLPQGTATIKPPSILSATNAENISVGATAFSDLLKKNIKGINNLQLTAHAESVKFATGESENLHELMILLEEAKLALQLGIEVRNRAIEAYQEITRMQI